MMAHRKDAFGPWNRKMISSLPSTADGLKTKKSPVTMVEGPDGFMFSSTDGCDKMQPSVNEERIRLETKKSGNRGRCRKLSL